MRIAALYDIHGNLPALEAVLAEIQQEAFDGIVIGGDAVVGPMPSRTLSLLQRLTVPTYFIHGNAESEVLRLLAGSADRRLPAPVEEVTRWVAHQLTPEQIQFLSSWQMTQILEIDGWGQVLFCHASPRNDRDVFTRLTSTEKLLPLFDELAASLVVCGHTHMQFDRTIGSLRLVNAGSVGMPFGKTGADWLMIDEKLVFRHTDYNLAQAAERIRQTDYPQAGDFAANNVLHSPTEADALAVFTQMENDQT